MERWQERNLYYLHTESKGGRHTPLTAWLLTELRRPAGLVGGVMLNTRCWIALALLSAFAAPAMAQSFRVQCPTNTITHPSAPDAEPPYSVATYTGTSTSYTVGKTGPANGAI